MPETPESVIVTFDFMADLTRLSREDQRRVLRALVLLDTDERTPSLRVHKLTGERSGQWSASASRILRIIFEHWGEGRKLLLECNHHYGDSYIAGVNTFFHTSPSHFRTNKERNGHR